MGLRKDLKYSCEYTGNYTVSGSCGSSNLDPKDTINEWISDNSLGQVKWELNNIAELIFANAAMYTIYSSMAGMQPTFPKHGGKITYKREIHIRVSPPDTPLPDLLQKALEERKFKKI